MEVEASSDLVNFVKNFSSNINGHWKVSDCLDVLKTKQEELSSQQQKEPSVPPNDKDQHILSELISVFETNDDGKITIEDLGTLAKNTIDGKLPLPKLNLTEKEIDEYDRASLYEKVFSHSKITLEYLRYYSLTTLSKRSALWIKHLFPTNHILTLIYIYIYSFITKEFLVFTIPLIAFYILFTAMILLTHDIFVDLNISIRLSDVDSLIHLIDDSSKRNSKESRDTAKVIASYRSYYAFFMVAFLNVFMFHLSDQHWVVSSVCCTLASVLLVITISSHGEVFDRLMKLLLAAIPFLSIFSDSMTSSYNLPFTISDNVVLFITATSILRTLVFLILMVLSIKRSIKATNGYYRVFLPTLSAITWCIILTMHYHNSSWSGLINSTVGWLIAIMASPVILIYLFLQFLGWMFSISLGMKLVIGFVLVVLLYTVYVLFENHQDVNTTLLVAFVVCVTAILIGSAAFSLKPLKVTSNGNQIVQDYCVLKNLDLPGFETQVKAEYFVGKRISWNGDISKSILLKIQNVPLDIISTIPYFSHDWLKCLFGSKNSTYEKLSSKDDSCSLSSYNKYTIRLFATVNCGIKNHTVKLQGGNELFHALRHFDPVGAKISFNASFTDHSSLLLKSFRISDVEIKSDDGIDVSQLMQNSFLKTLTTILGPIFLY